MALKRFKATIGFVVDPRAECPDPDECLLTVFIPDVDSSTQQYASVDAALRDQGFFAQYSLRLLRLSEDPDSVFRETRAWAKRMSSRVAFALMTAPSEGNYVLYRDSSWTQAQTTAWILGHLGRLTLTGYGGGKIRQHASDPNLLQLGQFNFFRGNFDINCTPAIDLVSGKFLFDFQADTTFFNTFKVSQPFLAGMQGVSPPGKKAIMSTSKSVLLFDAAAMNRLSHPVQAELDLYPHLKDVVGSKLSKIYLTRTGFRVLKGSTSAANRVLLNARDTLGRQLETFLGVEGQVFSFLPAPAIVHHELDHPDEYRIRVDDTVLVPQGIFPVQPAFPSGVNARRIKLGPSNTEVVEIMEVGGRPNLALEFLVQLEGGIHGVGTPTGGFLRQTLAKFAADLGASAATVKDLREGPVLTSLFDSVWPKFRAMDEHGGFREFASPAWGAAAIYSAQPDKIVRYGMDSPDAIGDALGYVRESTELPQEPMPFTFLDGIPDNPMGPNTRQSDLELALATHRFKLREASFRQGQRMARQPVRVKDSAPTRAVADKVNVTPQGFEVLVKADRRAFVLAKTERQSDDGSTEMLKLSFDVKNRNLNLLFQQDGYLLVLPTTDVAVPETGNVDVNGIDINAEIQLGSWAFNLEFRQQPASAGRTGVAPPPNNRSIVILKYRTGRLVDLLQDETTWTNYTSGLLKDDWVSGSKEALAVWLKNIEANKHDRAFAVINQVVNNDAWTGVLMINPTVDLDHLPEALQSLIAGIDLEWFRGHHIGFTQNKIDITKDGPFIQKSSLFGLIDYKDQRGFGHPKFSNGGTAPEDKFDFRVNTLQVVFSNSGVDDFDCLLRVYMPSWFKDAVNEIKGGPIPGHQPPGEKGVRTNVFGIRGRYEAFLDKNGQKVTRYSFVNDDKIKLVQKSTFIFEEVIIDRVELRTTKSHSPAMNKREIRSELILDAVVNFKKDLGGIGIDDVLSFDSLELSGISIPFEILVEKLNSAWRAADWNFNLPKLHFEGLSLGTDPARRRPGGLLSKFPIKFKTFRFFDLPKGLGEFKFLELFSNASGNFEYGLEWDIDFGALAKLLGLDSKLKGTFLVGWVPGTNGISLGLRFDDMGGDHLDIGIGSVLRLKAGYFDIFSSKNDDKGTFIVASDLTIAVFGEEVPKMPDKIGLILAPNPHDPLNGALGWLTTLKVEQLGFIENFILSLGQNMKYIGPGSGTASEIVNEVAKLQHFSLKPDMPRDKKKELSDKFRKEVSNTLEYNDGNDWFIALGGKVGQTPTAVTGHAVYNPPSLFGGEVGIEEFLTVSVVYRQETPQVGIYTGTLTLSENLRNIEIGPVRAQLPRVVVKVDTNGGYSVNIGLNEAKPDDFSNAAGAEMAIFKGDAGLLYANIHGSAFKDIPKFHNPQFPKDVSTHIFTPVTRIMIAGRFGLGRSFRKANLTAEASITIYGILSGTWGKRNLQKLSQAAQIAILNDRLPDQYNKYWGEVGVIAEIYGVVDFGITRLRLDARLLVGFGIVFETWKDTLAYIRGELIISLEWVVARFKVFGKTIEIKIPLNFSAEFREDYVLSQGHEDLYRKWFGGQSRTAAQFDARPYRAEGPVQHTFDWTRRPAAPEKQKPMPLVVTLDLTLDDTRKPKILPMMFIPYATGTGSGMTADPGPFKDLVNLVFDWSLLAAYSPLPGDGVVISFASLLDIEAEIATRDWAANRGSWAAAEAWQVLAEHFIFKLVNEWTGGLTGGTAFTPPEGFTGEASFGTGNPTQIKLGGTQVDSAYLSLLDFFFDKLRVRVEQDGIDDQRVAFKPGGNLRSLDEFLFEEFVESILRAVWGRIVGAIVRREREWASPPTVGQIRTFLAKESVAISGMLNRQTFSGARLPKQDVPNATQTVALWDKANRAIEVATWSGRGIKTLSLTQPQIGQTVVFDVQDASPIDELPNLKPAFGKVTVAQVPPFLPVEGERHPLPERVPLLVGGAETETFWSIPELLAAKASQRVREKSSQGRLKIRLEKAIEGETEQSTTRTQVAYDPVMLIALPVLSIGDKSDAFIIQQINETDRRLLDEFERAAIPSKDWEITVLDQIQGENGRLDALTDRGLDVVKSFIGRVNLSEDPNPPSFEAHLASRGDSFLTRASPVPAEYGNFFRLLRMGAETNSGGYFLHLEGWKNKEARRVWIAFRLKGAQYEGYLPAYVNWIATQGRMQQNSLGHVLRELDQQVLPAGEPGVFTARIRRQNPDTLYRDPTGSVGGPRYMTRLQALTLLEHQRMLSPGILVEAEEKGFLLAETLASAGGAEVDLAKRFNLIQVEIVEQGGFNALDGQFDLPAAPVSETKDASGDLIYNWSFPAHKFVKNPDNELFKSDNDPFVYGAIGREMTIVPKFRDVLGYSPEWPDQPSGVLKGRYFDPLISLMALTGLHITHEVNSASGNLKISLAFNPRAVVTAPGTSGPVSLPRDADGNLINGEDKRVLSVRATYARAMQQLRDKNTTYHVESVLCFAGRADSTDDRTALTIDERKELHGVLKACRDALGKLAQDEPIDALMFKALEFKQKGTAPKDGVARYNVRLCLAREPSLVWEEIADKKRSKVLSIEADIPLRPRTAGQGPTPARVLADAVVAAFPGKVRLAFTRDAQDAEALYIVNETVVTLHLVSDRAGPAFAALEPLSTKPYAVEGAQIWEWTSKKAPPRAQTPENDWLKREISNFDQDDALSAYLRDVDVALSPEQANDLWAVGGEGAQALDDLLRVKADISTAAPSRATSVLDLATDRRTIADAASPLQANLENSFKKRLGRISDVDTVLVLPMSYTKVGDDGKFLLYGRVAKSADIKADDHRFLPAALRRNGIRETLVIQLDAREPAAQESLKANILFVIDHIRWDRDCADTSFGVIWLKLFDPVEVALANNDGNPAPVTVPILFKKLVTKPDISCAPVGLSSIDPSWPMAKAIAEARKWTFSFDVERARAATQDDWVIDVEYNSRPLTFGAKLEARADRPIGEVLFEYTLYRLALNTPESRVLWMQALAYWGAYVARGLVPSAALAARTDVDLVKITQSFVLEEDAPGNGKLVITLKKRGSWPHDAFKYRVDAVGSAKDANKSQSNLSENPTSDALFKIEIDKPASPYESGEYYAGRRIGTRGLDILKHENAWPVVLIKRNATLHGFNGIAINPVFVYETISVRPGDPMTPVLDILNPILLPVGTGTTVHQQILSALGALFTEVFRGLEDPDSWPLVDMVWGYDSGQLDKYRNGPAKERDSGMDLFGADPIGMFPARRLKPDFSNGSKIVLDSLTAWQKCNLDGAVPATGSYVFKLRVYSRLDYMELPLLILSDLRYKL